MIKNFDSQSGESHCRCAAPVGPEDKKLLERVWTACLTAGVVLAAVLFIGFPGPVMAQDQPLLTVQEVDRFAIDWPRFLAWARDHGESFDRPVPIYPGFERVFGREAAEFIKEMGWRPERFSHVLDRVTVGLTGLGLEQNRHRVLSAMAAERKAVDGDNSLTQEEKDRKLAELEEWEGELERLESEYRAMPPEEVRLIKANQKRLTAAVRGVF